VRQERPAGLRQEDALRRPLEQRHAQLVLEQLEPPAHGGLRQVEERGGPREPAAADDRHECLDLIQLHGDQHSR